MAVTRKEIEEKLFELGLDNGDIVVVHSSLSSLGLVEGGAEAVVDAILTVIGPEGTLVVPTYNYWPDPFDPETTQSVVGAVTEAVRKRPDAIRSNHPTHSVAAIGHQSFEITAGHAKVTPFGTGSPLYKVLEMGGKVLLIGVNHTANSMIHVAEELIGVPYINRMRTVMVGEFGGGSVRKSVRMPGCSMGFKSIEDELELRGKSTEILIGSSRVRLIPANVVVSAAMEMLTRNPLSLLCDVGDCYVCAEARALIDAYRDEEDQERLAKELRKRMLDFESEFEEEHGIMDTFNILEEEDENGEYGPN